MPQIPTLPINEPVELPKASPKEFGIPGETVSGLGEETEQLAAGASEVEGHLIAAQRQLKAKEAEIAVDRVKAQIHVALSKATTPEEAQAIYDKSKGAINEALTPFETDRELSKSLGIYRQQEDVEIQNTVNAKKAEIITHADRAANEVLGQKSLQNAITTSMGGGDPTASRVAFDSQLMSSQMHGTITAQEHELLMQNWDREYQKGVILANINSPSSAIRQDTISQLKAGGGTFAHSMLGAEELGQLYTHAVDTDHNLTQKEEAGNLNGALNIKAEWFSSPEFKNPDGTPNYEAREKALDDGQQLIAHGIVTPDGKPNYVMAQKLQEDDGRQWQMHQKVQRDKDEEILEKYSPMIYDPKHPLSIQQIEALPQTDGASSRAVNNLKTALFQEQRNARVLRNEERSLGLEERREKRQELEDKSLATSLNLSNKMANGDVLDYNRDIIEPISKGQMTEADGAKVWRMYKASDQYPEIEEGLNILNSVFKAIPNTVENQRKAADTHDSFIKAIKDKNLHGADILKEAQSMAEQTGKVATGNFIQRMWNQISSGPIAAGAPAPVAQAAPAKSTAPPKTAGTMMFSDGKRHYVDADRKDLGVAQ